MEFAPDTTRALAQAHPAARTLRQPPRFAPVGNQARLRRLQAKLTIGAVGDPLEHEADAVAEQVMRMADAPSAKPRISRKCSACENEDKLQKKAADSAGGGLDAPASVDLALTAPGHALEPSTRAFFEPRFRADFSHIRIHHDDQAARSASEVGARAFAVDNHLVFGAGQFAPHSATGQKLLAHELTHTLQQGGARLRRAPCRPGAQCAPPSATNPGIKGDPATFTNDVAALEAAKKARLDTAPAGSPDALLKARLGTRATHFEHILSLHGIAMKPEVAGFFVNPYAIGDQVSAQTNTCGNFPGGAPALAPPDKFCVQLPAEAEDRAGGVDIAGPLTAPQNAIVADIIATGVHEMQHASFDNVQANSATRTIAAAADCNLDTPVGPAAPGFSAPNIEFLLSEISAETAEFAPYFQNLAGQANPQGQPLFDEERRIAAGAGESIQGAIVKMKCVCSCDTSDKFAVQAVNLTIAAWPVDQQKTFLQAMTRIIPSDWPAALHRN